MTTGALHDFQLARPRLFGVAYRMLGSATEAEDVVQDAWLRWERVTETVENPTAYLTTITTRLALTALDSARHRRETYIGPWLPEPVDTAADPLLGAERAEALSLAVLLLLERLSPAERAAYVLREAFAYSFRDIAGVLEISETNARKLASRARAHLAEERGAVVGAGDREAFIAAFQKAAEAGDLSSFERLLASSVAVVSDGGGVVSAARRIVEGPAKVAQFVFGVIEKFAHDLVHVPVMANGELALLGLRDGRPAALTTFDVTSEGATRILFVLNPEKLRGFDR